MQILYLLIFYIIISGNRYGILLRTALCRHRNKVKRTHYYCTGKHETHESINVQKM